MAISPRELRSSLRIAERHTELEGESFPYEWPEKRFLSLLDHGVQQEDLNAARDHALEGIALRQRLQVADKLSLRRQCYKSRAKSGKSSWARRGGKSAKTNGALGGTKKSLRGAQAADDLQSEAESARAAKRARDRRRCLSRKEQEQQSSALKLLQYMMRPKGITPTNLRAALRAAASDEDAADPICGSCVDLETFTSALGSSGLALDRADAGMLFRSFDARSLNTLYVEEFSVALEGGVAAVLRLWAQQRKTEREGALRERAEKKAQLETQRRNDAALSNQVAHGNHAAMHAAALTGTPGAATALAGNNAGPETTAGAAGLAAPTVGADGSLAAHRPQTGMSQASSRGGISVNTGSSQSNHRRASTRPINSRGGIASSSSSSSGIAASSDAHAAKQRNDHGPSKDQSQQGRGGLKKRGETPGGPSPRRTSTGGARPWTAASEGDGSDVAAAAHAENTNPHKKSGAAPSPQGQQRGQQRVETPSSSGTRVRRGSVQSGRHESMGFRGKMMDVTKDKRTADKIAHDGLSTGWLPPNNADTLEELFDVGKLLGRDRPIRDMDKAAQLSDQLQRESIRVKMLGSCLSEIPNHILRENGYVLPGPSSVTSPKEGDNSQNNGKHKEGSQPDAMNGLERWRAKMYRVKPLRDTTSAITFRRALAARPAPAVSMAARNLLAGADIAQFVSAQKQWRHNQQEKNRTETATEAAAAVEHEKLLQQRRELGKGINLDDPQGRMPRTVSLWSVKKMNRTTTWAQSPALQAAKKAASPIVDSYCAKLRRANMNSVAGILL